MPKEIKKQSRIIHLLATLLLTITIAACGTNEITNPPEKYNPFYKKYLDCNGIPVISSEIVHDRAFFRLKLLLEKVLENRNDIRQALINEGFKYIIIAQQEEVTDIPEYAHMEPKEYWNQRARGFGGTTTSCGEENLLSLPGDRYFNESIFIHELAHAIHLTGLNNCEPEFQDKLETLYTQAMDIGLYKDDYAATNPAEYWAESFQAFFDCDCENNHVHNHVNTRKELFEYDQDIAELIAKTMGINKGNDWSYYSFINESLIEAPPENLKTDKTITKYIWSSGFSIFGTTSTNDKELFLVNNLIRDLFYYRYDLLKKMTSSNIAIVIYSDCDEYITGQNDNYIEIKANTLLRDKNPLYTNIGEIVFELANDAFDQINDKDFHKKLKNSFSNNKDKWSGNSQRNISNEKIYFSTGVQLYFDGGSISNINSRESLREFDPELAQLVQDTFNYPNKKTWRISNYQ